MSLPTTQMKSATENRQYVYSFLFLAGVLLATFACYRVGFSAVFFFDDEPNLVPLGRLHSLADVYDFVFNGNAGPLGRPISLASFLLNHTAWPNDPAAFFYSNALIHLINACLLYWLLVHLFAHSRLKIPAMPWVAAWAAGLWALHPLLFSTSMFAVQRMTLLSATFVLIGLIAYLKARALPVHHKFRLPCMLFSLAGFGLLAGLSKENGFLLPIYVLVLEYTLLEQASNRDWESQIYLFLLWLIPVFTLGSLAMHWEGILAGYGSRPFTLEQRIYSESIILWDYVKQTFFPSRSGLNPFKGNEFLILEFNWKVLLALASWGCVMTLAFAKRTAWPWLAFGVSWFMVSHSIESTVIPLELYFHHRNYLASGGLLIGTVIAISQTSPKYRIWGYRVFALILAAYGFVLYQAASVWGNVPIAAALWYEEQPKSERAVQFQARALAARGDWEGAYQIIMQAAQAQPHFSAFKLQQLQTSCGIKTGEDLQRSFQFAAENLDQTYKSPATTDALDKIRQMVENQECSLTASQVLELHDLLMRNSSFQKDGNLRFELHMIRARIYKHLRELDPMMADLEAAFAIRPTLNLGTVMAYELATAELFDDAERKLKEIETHAPRNPLLRQIWQKEIKEAHAGLSAMRLHSEDQR